jgi:hypothetical protein
MKNRRWPAHLRKGTYPAAFGLRCRFGPTGAVGKKLPAWPKKRPPLLEEQLPVEKRPKQVQEEIDAFRSLDPGKVRFTWGTLSGDFHTPKTEPKAPCQAFGSGSC